MEQTFELPWPPSINHYYRNVQGRTLISKEGRDYRDRIGWLLREAHVQQMKGHLAMRVELYPPDARRRDIDNVQKALWDALQHGGLYVDDSQIKRFLADMHEPMPPAGLVVVTVKQRLADKAGATKMRKSKWQDPGPNSGYWCPSCKHRPLIPVTRLTGSSTNFTVHKECPTCQTTLLKVNPTVELGKEA